MSIATQRFNSESIVIITVTAPVAMPDDPMGVLQSVVDFKREVGGHIIRILDFSKSEIDFSSMIMGMAAERGQEGGSSDPDVTTIFVGTDEMVRLGVKSLQEQEQYEAVNIRNFYSTVDEALADARSI